MTSVTKWSHDPLMVSGIWKFSPAISLGELMALAEEWRDAHPQEYVDIHIRGVGKNNALGIGFRYKLPQGLGVPAETSTNKFFHEMTDKLKRLFGNDFVGWDISRFTYVLT